MANAMIAIGMVARAKMAPRLTFSGFSAGAVEDVSVTVSIVAPGAATSMPQIANGPEQAQAAAMPPKPAPMTAIHDCVGVLPARRRFMIDSPPPAFRRRHP